MNFGSWLSFSTGPIEVFLAVVFGFIGLMTMLYSFARIRGSKGEIAEYYVFFLLLISSAFGVVFASNLLLLFVFWELATVAAWRLVSYFRNEEAVLAGAWAFYINFIAAALMFVGLVLIQLNEGTLDLQSLAGKPLAIFPAILILTGIFAKSATLPLYIWLPRAYRQAPSSICALLSGVAENLGLVLFLKLYIITMVLPKPFLLTVGVVAVVSSLVASGVALNAKTIRETLAYSTVGQVGFALLGFACAGYYGLIGAMFYIMAHAVAKSGIFLAAGTVEDAAGSGDLSRLGGFARISPALAGATAVLMLSVMGLPPTLGFFAKIGVVLSAVRGSIILGIGALVAALFTILYLSRLYSRIFLGSNRDGYGKVSGFTVFLVAVMALGTILAGVLWFVPARFLEAGFSGLGMTMFRGGW
ncbi:MAG: complex I subunit 5 family protein [bacterium]